MKARANAAAQQQHLFPGGAAPKTDLDGQLNSAHNGRTRNVMGGFQADTLALPGAMQRRLQHGIQIRALPKPFAYSSRNGTG
ncbi:hypothetical protein SDC9_173108 [bioreactor metagenome]|uniref:Uncharacterized protein n=1 Tax=bioreactor metagenome TaxID=1076179 RepID=A0A645GP15_9ZZZZ